MDGTPPLHKAALKQLWSTEPSKGQYHLSGGCMGGAGGEGGWEGGEGWDGGEGGGISSATLTTALWMRRSLIWPVKNSLAGVLPMQKVLLSVNRPEVRVALSVATGVSTSSM